MAAQTKQKTGRQVPLYFLLLITLALFFPRPALSGKQPSEFHIKAIFLYNLANFVNWPESWQTESDNFIIGIFGDDPFGDLIDKAVVGEKYRNRHIIIVRYSRMEELRNNLCHILFITSTSVKKYNEVLHAVEDYPILTVGDTPGFAENGGMVNLLKKQQQVEVEINQDAAHDGNLFISSKLLRLARIVDSL